MSVEADGSNALCPLAFLLLITLVDFLIGFLMFLSLFRKIDILLRGYPLVSVNPVWMVGFMVLRSNIFGLITVVNENNALELD